MKSNNEFHLSSKLADPAKLKATFQRKLRCSFFADLHDKLTAVLSWRFFYD